MKNCCGWPLGEKDLKEQISGYYVKRLTDTPENSCCSLSPMPGKARRNLSGIAPKTLQLCFRRHLGG